jgi:alpha-tubulin suppressor-like RCC1 family protein
VVSDGSLLCWGHGDRGQLGSGGSGVDEKRTAPAAVPAPDREAWVDVAAGGRATCARLASGRLTCFGDNSHGGLGDGSFVDRARPAPVGNDADWALAAVGLRNACGRKADGRLLCWGRNLSGALGVGAGGDATTPRETGSGAGWTQLATGGGHACGIQLDGTLWCWGTNFDGELGIGVEGGARDAPVEVAGGGAWSQVAAGEGITCAVKSDGELYCWGYNFYGQLGIGTQGAGESRSAPTRVVSGAEGPWTRVTVRSAHTCALKDGGALYCWGLYSLGRLGLGPNLSANVVTPARVPGTWSAVAAGAAHTCGVQGGGLYCWGYNGSGQLGTGATPPNNDPAPSPLRIGSAVDWAQVVAGGSHSCALRGAQSQLFCWGANFYGQIGNGSSGNNANAYTPSAIAFGRSWVALTAGGETTCGVASDNNLYCWGSNTNGLCANGLVGEKVVTPVMVDATRNWAQVGLMSQTGCAAHVDGSLACWGVNDWGQFGDDTAFYEVPEAVAR